MKTIVIAFAASYCAAFPCQAASPDGWTNSAPRKEIRPEFQREAAGGQSGHGALVIRADGREGLHGWWEKTFLVTAGRHYRFTAWRRTERIAGPRRLGRGVWCL